METSTKEHAQRGHKTKLVTVTVDGVEHKIERGKYTGKELKQTFGVEPNRELLEIKGKKLVPIGDCDETNVSGQEVFVTHVCTGTSS